MDGEQPSFTDAGYGNRRRVSRREQFPATMDATLPWARWVGLIEPHHYSDRPGKTGRTAKPVATMLRMYLLQVWFSLSGAAWVRVASPSPGDHDHLQAVAATSTTDAWAVGDYDNGQTAGTLILHWDGAAWTQVPSP